MAKPDITKELENYGRKVLAEFENQSCGVITGGNEEGRYLLYRLQLSIREADRIDMIVSFLKISGVRLILNDLKDALAKGTHIRILTGRYLGITEPGALYLIKDKLGDQVELRFYDDQKRSFHPKAYIFHKKDYSEMYIGSSNISESALKSGIEWNYHFDDKRDSESLKQFEKTFDDLFYHHSIIADDRVLEQYSKEWRVPSVEKDLDRYASREANQADEVELKPQGAQIEALYALRKSREGGAERALIYAATGIGKTYLAAFDSKDYERILFVAHRDEILLQAAESFKNVRHSDDYGFFNNKEKAKGKAVIFASVNSLGKTRYLNDDFYPRDYFDYIVIDEFHHAVADQYRNIIEYFKPRFLLGLTATPERMDGRSIYELCNYNVPYQISLQDAVNKGYLVPFHYYGIFDETVDYSKIQKIKGSYVEKELTESLSVLKRYDLIYKHYMKYRSRKALGFCCSRKHAEEMAKQFCLRNIPAVAVYSDSSGEYSQDRNEALKKLRSGEIKIIFSVDMFNEGLDICDIDMVMFLRPTESPVVFLQQLGRGLRKHKGKSYLNVLDFIGNYEKAGIVPYLLSGQLYSSLSAVGMQQEDFFYPDDCLVDFDMRLIDLFHEMAKRGIKKEDRVRAEYYRIKELLGGRNPTRMELFTYMEDEVIQMCSSLKNNPFRHYLRYLDSLQELGGRELAVCNSAGNELLEHLEATLMNRSYKMPVLEAFYNDGNVKTSIDEEDIYRGYMTFYHTANYRADLENSLGSNDFQTWDKKRCVKEALKNPVKFLLESGKGFFVKEKESILALEPRFYSAVAMPGFAEQMKDVIEYRTMEYFSRNYRKKR